MGRRRPRSPGPALRLAAEVPGPGAAHRRTRRGQDRRAAQAHAGAEPASLPGAVPGRDRLRARGPVPRAGARTRGGAQLPARTAVARHQAARA